MSFYSNANILNIMYKITVRIAIKCLYGRNVNDKSSLSQKLPITILGNTRVNAQKPLQDYIRVLFLLNQDLNLHPE